MRCASLTAVSRVLALCLLLMIVPSVAGNATITELAAGDACSFSASIEAEKEEVPFAEYFYRGLPHGDAIWAEATGRELDPALVAAVVEVESSFRADAISHASARGLMQLVPHTARRFGVADPFDPTENVRGGTEYLRFLAGLYDGNETLMLAAYNAGEHRVEQYGGVPPYAETVHYIRKVRRARDRYAKRERTFVRGWSRLEGW